RDVVHVACAVILEQAPQALEVHTRVVVEPVVDVATHAEAAAIVRVVALTPFDGVGAPSPVHAPRGLHVVDDAVGAIDAAADQQAQLGVGAEAAAVREAALTEV